MRILIVIYLMILFASFTFPINTDYYITLSGTGTGTGDWTNARSFNNMWATDGGITWSSLSSGDRVFIAGGTYTLNQPINCTNRVGTLSSQIRITAGKNSPQINTNYDGIVTIQCTTNTTGTNYILYNIDLSSSKYLNIDDIKFISAYKSNINFELSENCSIKSCSVYAYGITQILNGDTTYKGSSTGVSGISANKTKNLTIENNYIETRSNNNWQVDCIKVGGLGTGAVMTSDETLIIRYNQLINNSNYSEGHDDCIQFYTDIDNDFWHDPEIEDYIVRGSKRYYYYKNDQSNIHYFQIVNIYGNYISQTGSNDIYNTGIIIGGADPDYTIYSAQNLDSSPYDQNHYYPDLSFNVIQQQGKYTKWKIWSNIFRHNNGIGLLDFSQIDPASIEVFNNTFFSNSSAGEGFIYHRKWLADGGYSNSTSKAILRNFILKNNIFSSISTSTELIKFGDSNELIEFTGGNIYRLQQLL